MLTALDHAFVVLFAVLWPFYITFFEMPRFRRRQAAGDPPQRIRDYATTMATQWTLAALALTIWATARRPWAELGLRPPHGLPFWIGAALVAAAITFLAWQLAMVRRMAAARERLRRQLAALAFLLPTRPHEMGVFYALALTAGVCEELLVRGYLLWYLEHFVSLPGAVALSSLMFGLAHSYQGRNGAFRAGLAGVIMAGLYASTRSLLLPIVAHALVDALGGRTAYEALREEPKVATAA